VSVLIARVRQLGTAIDRFAVDAVALKVGLASTLELARFVRLANSVLRTRRTLLLARVDRSTSFAIGALESSLRIAFALVFARGQVRARGVTIARERRLLAKVDRDAFVADHRIALVALAFEFVRAGEDTPRVGIVWRLTITAFIRWQAGRANKAGLAFTGILTRANIRTSSTNGARAGLFLAVVDRYALLAIATEASLASAFNSVRSSCSTDSVGITRPRRLRAAVDGRTSLAVASEVLAASTMVLRWAIKVTFGIRIANWLFALALVDCTAGEARANIALVTSTGKRSRTRVGAYSIRIARMFIAHVH